MHSHLKHVFLWGLPFWGSLQGYASNFNEGESVLPPLEESQQVLATKVVRMGKDTFTYRRVSPPTVDVIFKDKLFLPIVANLVTELESIRDEISFTYDIIPYPSGVSEIRWMDEFGGQKRVFVCEDLTYLEFSFGVAVERNYYSYCTFNYGTIAGASLQDYSAEIQGYVGAVKNIPVGQFIAVPAMDKKFLPLTEVEVDAIEVMLSYYHVNRAVLKAAHEEALARWTIEVETKRIRDLTPQAVEIRLWPVTSQRYSTAK